jgi:PAS domain S-box-containing protein
MQNNFFTRNSLKTRLALTMLGMILLSLWSLALYANRQLRQDLQSLIEQQQFSAASLVAAEIDQEVGDRLRALESIAAEIHSDLLASAAPLQDFLEHQPLLQAMFNGGTFVTDASGVARASLPHSAKRIGVSYISMKAMNAELLQGRPSVGKPHTGLLLNAPVLTLAVPVRDAQNKSIGVLVGVIDLGQPNFLDKITSSAYGNTGGYVLVAKKYRLIITATDKSRTLETLPAPGVMPLADRFIQGFEGSGFATTPKGVPVLASAKGIPTADWYLAVLLPTEEAFAPIDRLLRDMLLATSLASLLGCLGVWWLVRRHLAPLSASASTLAAMIGGEQFPAPLDIVRIDEVGTLITAFNHLMGVLQERETALRQSEQRFRILIEWTPDTYAIHRNGKIIYVNPAGVKLFGATSEQDILGKPILDFVHPDDRQTVMARVQGSLEKNINPPLVEEKFLKLDGSTIEAEIQGQLILYDGQPASQVVLRDVGERKQRQRRLEQLLAEQKAMLENDLVGIIKVVNRKIVRTNSAHEKMFGYGPGEMDGASARPNYPSEESFQATSTAAYRALAAGGIFSAQIEQVRKDGSRFWVDMRGVALDSQLRETLWVFLDITARIQIEDDLRRVKDRYDIATMIGKVGTWDWDPRSGDLAWSDQTFRLMGFEPGSVTPTYELYLGLVHPDDREFLNEGVQCALHERKPYALDCRIVLGNAKEIICHVTGKVEFDANDQPMRMLGTIQDITERKNAERALCESEEKYRLIFDESVAAVFVFDASKNFIDANQSGLDLLGYSRQELLHMSIPEVDADPVVVQPAHEQLLAGQQIVNYEHCLRRKDGTVITVLNNSIALTDQSGKVVGMLSTLIDVSERKQAEVALQSALRDKMALLHEVHHRVKNNLQVITSLLQLEAGRSAHADTKDVLGNMKTRIRSMGQLHELLYRSGNFASVDLSEYVRQLATQTFRDQSHTSERIRLQLELSSVCVSMDQASPCGLLLIELLTNCLKHGFPQGREGEIRVQLQASPALDESSALWCLRVIDNGVGLSNDFTARCGQSLGLQLVSDLARQINGRLTVEPGPGASFAVTFVLAAAQ